MADDVRVALLGRPGPAREQLRKALVELGAILVAEGDPAELDPDEVGALKPNLMLVSLEPAIEPALERFDALLTNDDVEVMYDDAEVTRHLEGWDLNRWARHLAAKLLGHDLMPPPPDDAPAELPDMQPVPGAPPTPAQLMDNEKLEDYTAESPELAEWVPTNPSLTPAVAESDVPDAPREREPDELPDFDLDLGSIESAMLGGAEAADDTDLAPMPVADSVPDADVEEFSFGDISLELGGLEDLIGTEPTPEPELDPAMDEPLLADLQLDGGPVNFSQFSVADPVVEASPSMDDDVAELAAQLEEFEKSDKRETARDPDFSWATNDNAAKAVELKPTMPSTRPPQPEVAAPPSIDFGNLSLAGDDDPVLAAPVVPKFGSSTPAPSASTLTLSLEPEPGLGGDTSAGTVLIVAGMGGPDAVRQLLASLPPGLPVPVLLYQHLEVGRHDRLVDQLGRVSKLGVYLAEAGENARPNKVAILPAGIGGSCANGAVSFAGGSLESLLRALPAANTILVFLSGADPALVPAAADLCGAGATVLTQLPETCFDATAITQLLPQGARAMDFKDVAATINKQWLTLA